MESAQPNEVATGAEVNASPVLVALYDLAGEAIYVLEHQVERWLGQGYRRSPIDLGGSAQNLGVLFDAARDAVKVFVAGVVADGRIDPADGAALATAQLAMRELEAAWGDVTRAIHQSFPLVQGPSVTLADPTGGEPIAVDPSQVDHYAAQGWEVPR